MIEQNLPSLGFQRGCAWRAIYCNHGTALRRGQAGRTTEPVLWLFLVLFAVISPLYAGASDPKNELGLTSEEVNWLRSRPVWNVAGGPAPPFQWVDDKGELAGMAGDYASIIQKRLGVRFHVIPAGSWSASLVQLRNKVCDVSLLTADTPAREEFLLFTDDLLKLPLVIIAPSNTAPIQSLGSLAGKRVAIARNWPIHEFLLRDHPEIELAARDDVSSGLSMVAMGEAAAFIGDLASATYSIERLGIRNLRVAGETPYTAPFRIAVRKDSPEAVSILNKVIRQIPSSEQARIRRRNFPLDSQASVKALLEIALPMLVGGAIITLLLTNVQLRREVRRRRSAECALRENEQRWSFALEGSRDGVWDWDIVSDRIFVSQRWKQLLGFQDGETPRALSDLLSHVDPADREAAADKLRKHLDGETAFYQAEHRVRTAQGERRWVLARGTIVERDSARKPLRFVGTHMDITEWRRAQIELTEYKERLEELVNIRTAEALQQQEMLASVVQATAESVFLLDLNGIVLAANHIGAERFGCEVADLVGTCLFDWMPPEVAAFRRAKVREAIETKAMVPIHDERGGKFFSTLVNPILNDERVTGLVVLAVDVTETRQLTAELQQAKDAAEAASRAKSVFLANMSHEIRTPLNAILGFSRILLRSESFSSADRKRLETVYRSGEHLFAVINDVLEMSRIEMGGATLSSSVFDLRATMSELERMFRLRTEAKGLDFVVDVSRDVPAYIETDHAKFRQILVNLIGNAVKFTQAGRIIVRVGVRSWHDREVRLGLEVEDTGPGISEEELPVLFTRFGQASAGRKIGSGSGLGLAISREYVRLMGGDIRVKSEPGIGSIFSFDATVLQGAAPSNSGANGSGVIRVRVSGPSPRILVADDKQENCELLRQMLAPAGFEVMEAENGRRAVELFLAWKPDLILMDLSMPVMSGEEAIAAIRMLTGGSRVRIVAVTATAFSEDRQRVMALGVDGFFAKPLREEDLISTICELLNLQTGAAPDVAADPALTKESVSALPVESRKRLRDAVLRADLDAVLQELQEYDTPLSAVTNGLRNRIEHFEYESVLELLDVENVP